MGTTVVRALASAAGLDGRVRAREGWTDLMIEADSPVRSLDGLLSGFHDSDSSHLSMLEAIAGRDLLDRPTPRRGGGHPAPRVRRLHLLLP